MSSKYKLCTIYWINSKKKKTKKLPDLWLLNLCIDIHVYVNFSIKYVRFKYLLKYYDFGRRKILIYIKKIPKHLHCLNINSSIKFLFLFFSDTIFFLNFEVSFQAKKKIQKNIKVFVMLMYHNIFVNSFAIYLQQKILLYLRIKQFRQYIKK